MAELTEAQKSFLVVSLAQFNTPTEVRELFREAFGEDLLIQQIVTYDPTRPAFEAGDKWVQVFEQARQAYITDVSAIPIANQAFRLNKLHKLAAQAEKAGNRGQAAALYKQAAEEVGGAFTNERNVKVEKTGGGFKDLTTDERRTAVADMIREAMSKDPAQTAPSTGRQQ